MSKQEVTSTGSLGPDFTREHGRAYNNVGERVGSYAQLLEEYRNFHAEALKRGRRRTVFRTTCTPETFQELVAHNELPLEVAIPLDLVFPNETGYIIMLGENIHPSEIPEWQNVYRYWQSAPQQRTPAERICQLPSNYSLTTAVEESESQDLFDLWQPFSWSLEQIQSFIAARSSADGPTGKWFAGVRDPEGRLVSACMAEQLDLGEIPLIETTEYATMEGSENRGLCRAAVIALIAQIIRDTVHAQNQIPLIVAEFNMSSRSDVVGRQAGMTIPLVEGVANLDQTPIQVLRRNVSVLDRRPVNTLSWSDLTDNDRQYYRESYRNSNQNKTYFRYWRNFLYGMLPKTAIDQYYSPEEVQNILNHVR